MYAIWLSEVDIVYIYLVFMYVYYLVNMIEVVSW